MVAGPVPSIYLCEQDLVLYAGDSSAKLRSYFHGHEHCPLHLPTLLLYLFNKSQQGLRCHLSWFVAVCPAESVRRFVMQNIVKRLLSMQQPHKHFLNETSQTQRQTPVQSTGRHKLFHCVLDCQEEFCKYFNEGWTAPRQGCWKLIPDHLQYRSSNSSVFPSKLLGFAASLFRN